MYNSISDLNLRELNKQGVEVHAFKDTEAKQKQRWYATLGNATVSKDESVSTTGAEATVVCVFRSPFANRRDRMTTLENAPKEVQEFFNLKDSGMSLQKVLADAKLQWSGYSQYKNSITIYADIEVMSTLKNPIEGVDIAMSVEAYDAEFSERLEFPFSQKKLDEAILDMEYAIEDWKNENKIKEVE
jgi:hypothetical protein